MLGEEEQQVADINEANEEPKAAEDVPATEKKPSKIKQLWQKTGLDVKTLLMMFKGSLPPTIAIAMYQSTVVAEHYTTLGYLVAIASVLGMAIMPRGRFIQNMLLNTVIVGLAAAINLLALYCVVKAREHTTPPGVSLRAYNSSASAVAGLWLFVQIYLISYLRNARAQFRFPAIIYSIFALISMLEGPIFPNMTAAISYMENLMESFLTGFAIATAVQFLVFPVSSRKVVFGEMTGYAMSIAGVLNAQVKYMQRMETLDPRAVQSEWDAKKKEAAAAEEHNRHHHFRKKNVPRPDGDATEWQSSEGIALKSALTATLGLHAKLNQDVASVHTEFAIGKLDASDIDRLWDEIRRCLTPVMGLMSIIDQIRDLARIRHWASSDLPPEDLRRNRESIESLHTVMRALHGPVESMTGLITAGMKHALLTLEFIDPPKKSKKADVESKGDANSPGSPEFAAFFESRVDEFENSKHVTLDKWCASKGIPSPDELLAKVHSHHDTEEFVPRLLQKQLFLMLYVEYLILRLAQRVLTVIMIAEEYKQSPKFKHKRLIFPGSTAIYNGLRSLFRKEDLSHDEHLTEDTDAGAADVMDLGQSYRLKKDPEHLPPTTFLEKVGDKLRLIPKFFKTDDSAFGFRVAAASLSIGVVDYLQVSQNFFQQQRLTWALIMVAISMSRTAGQSTFNFLLRVFGTVIAMIGAYICWYIVDGKTPGVIVFMWLWIFCCYYVVFKMPKYLIVGILSIVTVVLILGYELQVVKLGKAQSESNGQPAYPTYELAPYRLACVAGGLFVAWIWTIWPYPVTENSELRKDIGASLYMLANYYGLVHETVKGRTSGRAGDAKVKGTHAYNLDQTKQKVFMKIIALLARMQENSSFQSYQFVIGGKFPTQDYQNMINGVRRCFIAISLMQHASDTLALRADSTEKQTEWARTFRSVVAEIGETSHRVTSALSLLSSSLLNAQPLPPYMQLPKPFAFVDKLQAIDKDLMSISHMVEPEYSAVVVIQVATESLNASLDALTTHIRSVVGEMDFSFHAIADDHGSSTATAVDSDKSSDEVDRQK